jgi:CubicO group peptidase (beta-lactamase class C family)
VGSGPSMTASAPCPLEDYFRQHIFAPLKMDDTSYNVPEAKGPRLVAQQQRARELNLEAGK